MQHRPGHRADINWLVLQWFAAAAGDLDLQAAIAALLQVTAAYNLAGRDVRELFRLLHLTAAGLVPAHTACLLRAMVAVAREQGPASFFHFADAHAGIKRTVALPSRALLGRGFTWAAWVRLEAAGGHTAKGGAPQNLLTLLHRGGEGSRGIVVGVRGMLIGLC